MYSLFLACSAKASSSKAGALSVELESFEITLHATNSASDNKRRSYLGKCIFMRQAAGVLPAWSG